MAEFAHLHVHSDYSLLRSTASIPSLVARAAELGYTHLAITDDGNMFGALEFYKACRDRGITPVVGCDFFVVENADPEVGATETGKRFFRLVLLARNAEGYKTLMRLSSRAYTEGFYYRPRIDPAMLEADHNGVIGLSGSVSGEIPSLLLRNRREEAYRRAAWYRDLLGPENFYLELQNQRIPEQATVNPQLVELGRELGIPLVATNECYYVHKEDANAQDILMCVGSGRKKNETNRFRFSSDEFYLKSPEEMRTLFAELPEAVENSVRIAERCNLEIELPGPIFPDYHIPQEFESDDAYLRHITYEGLRSRYDTLSEEITERADYELDTIIGMGFTGYFLIVWDFIAFARNHDIPVGPGRGSGAGSIVAYALQITDIDPLKYGLLFERFLNPDRISMPDFDIDFCYERRNEVIRYVTEKYGAEKVGQIITFGTLKARAVIRDVARALDLPFAESDMIAKLVPARLDITLAKALDEEPRLRELREQGGVHQELIEVALKLEGLHRHPSTHAAGIVIGREALTEYVPLYRDPRTKSISTQYTMDQLEDCGLVKMDFLGLKTLTLIRNTENLIRGRGLEFDIEKAPENDEATFRLLGLGKSACIFQFESAGMQKILTRARPERIEDLIALNALYRPGPMENIDQFVDSKNGRTPISYPLPELEHVLKETYGVIVYQEQVMEIVRIVGGFSLGQADILRRAMGKKKLKEMEQMKKQFLEGARERGFGEKQAETIFDLLQPFAGYGFNKSHAAAYSVLAYKTAYLKANYPVEFMAANLTNEISSQDKFSQYIEETRSMGIEIAPPDLNRSNHFFTVEDGRILYGLLGIKNLGSAAVDEIVRVREAAGPFESFIDFLERVNLSAMNRKMLEVCIQAGVFDSLGTNRATLLHNLGTAIEFAAATKENRRLGQVSLFDEDSAEFGGPQFERLDEVSLSERLQWERDHLGMYLSGHPLDEYRDRWKATTSLNLARPGTPSSEKLHAVLGLVKSSMIIYTKNGRPMMFLVIEDFNGSIECVLFEELCEQHRDTVEAGSIIGIIGKLELRNDKLQLVVTEIREPEEMDERDTGEIHIRIAEELEDEDELYQLRAFLFEHAGGCPVYLHIGRPENETVVRASSQLTISAKSSILDDIRGYPRVLEVWKQ